MQNRHRVVILMAGGLLSACATVDDPGRGGFFDGIANLATGGYEKRITDRETELQGQQAVQVRLERQTAMLQQEQVELERELAAASARLDRLDAAIQAQQQRLQRERQARNADQARLRQAQARLQQAQANAGAIRTRLRQTAQPGRPVADSRRDVQNLQTRIDGLNDLVKTLAE